MIEKINQNDNNHQDNKKQNAQLYHKDDIKKRNLLSPSNSPPPPRPGNPPPPPPRPDNPPPPPPDDKPPLQLSTILRWAWGITMSLSDQEAQQELVKIFKDRFDNLIKMDTIMDKVDQVYLNEISLVISGMIRSYGYQREVYLINIKALQEICKVQIDYYTNTVRSSSQSTTVSKQPTAKPSFPPPITTDKKNVEATVESSINSKNTYNGPWSKAIAFFGSGSIGLLPILQGLFQELGEPSEGVKNLVGNITVGEISKSSIGLEKLVTALEGAETLSLISILPILVPLFLVIGAIGYGIYNFIAGKYAYNKVKRIKMQETEVLHDFWITTMKPSLIEMFLNLTKELKELHKKYYQKEDDSLPNNDKDLRKLISDRILPHDNTYIYIPRL
jgi:hypothetical protein